MLTSTNRKQNRGFTLAELLIVVAIIGVLVAVSIPIFTGQREKAKSAVCSANRRSLLAAYRAEQLSGDEDTDTNEINWIKTAAIECGGTASGLSVTGLCPDGGTISFTTYADGTLTICCNKHNPGDSYAAKIDAVLNDNMTRSTKSGTQTLKAYFDDTKTHRIDSEATGADKADKSWNAVINSAIGNISSNQSWALTKNKTTGNYEIYLTTGGNIKNVTSGTTVSVILYTYDSSGKLVSTASKTVKVATYKKDTLNYNYLDLSTVK
jgi:prepilin-type N-terminal cleavage/methylation domain-containing protein